MRAEKGNTMEKKWTFSLAIVVSIMIGLVAGVYGTSLKDADAVTGRA